MAAARVPSATAFDFLEGEYKAAVRVRLANLVVAGLVVVAAAATLLLGVTWRLADGSLSGAVADAQQSLASTKASTDRLLSVNGYPKSQLVGHVQSRGGQVLSAAAGEAALTDVFANLLDAASRAGATLGAVQQAAPAGAPASPPPAQPQASASGGLSFVVTATVTSYDQLQKWETAVKAEPLVASETTTWAGNVSQIQARTSVTLKPATATRASALCTELGLAAAKLSLPGCGAATPGQGQAGPGAAPGAVAR